MEELEQEELDERLLDVAGTAHLPAMAGTGPLPSVPDTEVPVPSGKLLHYMNVLKATLSDAQVHFSACLVW